MALRLRVSPRRFGNAAAVLVAAILLAPRVALAADESGAVPGADGADRQPQTGEAVRAEEPVDDVCSVGSFETRPEPGGFDIYYTNLSARACRSVSYYCLWGMLGSGGFYRQSADGSYQGLIGAGEALRIGTIEPKGGPADREVVWSWCIPKR